jgi:hypothetical protein
MKISAWRSDPQFCSLVVLVVITLLSGIVFYSQVEGWSVVDAPPLGSVPNVSAAMRACCDGLAMNFGKHLRHGSP